MNGSPLYLLLAACLLIAIGTMLTPPDDGDDANV